MAHTRLRDTTSQNKISPSPFRGLLIFSSFQLPGACYEGPSTGARGTLVTSLQSIASLPSQSAVRVTDDFTQTKSRAYARLLVELMELPLYRRAVSCGGMRSCCPA
jgi:hypothetical protein